jgi:cell division protein FtsB
MARNFQEKRSLKHILQSKPVLILLSIMVLVFAWSVLGLLGRMQETAQNKKIAEDKITELQKRKGSLSSEIDDLKTEQGVEENIREKFGLAKDGEGMIIIEDDKNQVATPPGAESNAFFSFFKNIFK